MARKPGFKVTNTNRGWKVEVPAQYSSSEKRERTYFPTRDAANKFAVKQRESVKSHGENALAIKPSLADEATRAQTLLEPYGISILEAARRIVVIEKANAASKDVIKATLEFQLTKETKGEGQRRAYEQMALALSRDFEGRTLASITPEELLEHVESHAGTNSTFNSRATSLKTFWKWCSLTPRNWCNPKVTEILEKRETRKNTIEVLDEKECRSLLQTAEKHYPECVPLFAIALFTGMRKSEIKRLEPEDFKPNGISLLADIAKTGTRRFIEIPPPLAAWLAAYPIAETVLPANWERKEEAVRRIAGWRVWCDLFDPPAADPDLPRWSKHLLRHTHASVQVALGKPIDALIFEFGHSGGTQTLKAHYLGQMTKEEAEKIWSIGPNGTTIPLGEESPRPLAKQARPARKKEAP